MKASGGASRRCSSGRRRGPDIALALALACACGGDAGGTDTASTGGATTTATTTTPATTSDATTSDATTSSGGDSTTDEPDATTGAPPADLAEACQRYCAGILDCKLLADEGLCLDLCAESYAAEGACEAAFTAWLGCVAGTTCEDLWRTLFFDESPRACAGSFAEVGAACEFDPCSLSASGDASGCRLTLLCPGGPLQVAQCDAESCLCFEDGEATGMCAAEGVCEALDASAIAEHARECCGF